MSNRIEITGPVCRLFAGIILLLSVSFSSYAQRTMHRQNHIAAEVVFPYDFSTIPGGEISWGQYMLSSYWKAWAGLYPDQLVLKTKHSLEYLPIVGGCDYMYRLISTRSRLVNLYCGGGVFLGYEIYDPFKKIPTYIDIQFPEGIFIYGINVNLESEIFLSRTIAFLVGLKMPVVVPSKGEIVRLLIKTGIRINI